MSGMEKSKFRVIIVGGSIAGLTLAHCLDRAEIDHIVLERRDDISPQVGASIGIMPNGGRVLEQLGIFDEVEKEIEPLRQAHICYPDGFFFSSSYPVVLHERFGFPLAFLDRQKLLKILYTSLKDKSKVHVNKKVVEVQQLKSSLRVSTSDGSFYDCDLVVGADGVHSKVRSEMWRIADTQQPGLITMREKNNMCAEFTCIFGISSAVSGLKIGEQITHFYNGLTIITFHCKKGRISWFVIQKMEKKYRYPNVPRFAKEDAAKACHKLQNVKVWKDVVFGDIWARKEVCSMTALEENVFQTWYYGRIVCIGDSMHKMTPNLGQGANSAIESAAALANALQNLANIKRSEHPTDAEINGILGGFNRLRLTRMIDISKTSRFVTRFQARDGTFNKLFGRYLVPLAKDLPADMSSKTIAGGVMLKYLPRPKRSGTGWDLFHPSEPRWIHQILKVSVFFVLVATLVRILKIYGIY